MYKSGLMELEAVVAKHHLVVDEGHLGVLRLRRIREAICEIRSILL
jgi:hypothetical protein